MKEAHAPAAERALVIGGTGGIGFAVSLRLAAAGVEVCVHGGSSKKRLEKTLAAIRAVGRTADGFLCRIDRVEHLVEPIRQRLPFTIVVVAFGPYLQGALTETTVRDWVRMSELNLALPGAVISLCAPAMQKAGYGRFVLFGGPRTDGIEGFRAIGAYAAAKTGVSSLVRSAARQLSEYGITVNAVCPGYVATEYYDRAELARLSRRMPDGQLVTADQVAEVVERLVQPGAAAVNGAIIRIDKGV